MRRSLGREIQLLARFLADANAGLPALSHQLFQASIVAFLGDQNVVKTATPGLQCLFHRMQTVQNFHER
jgi:hypothetical protein